MLGFNFFLQNGICVGTCHGFDFSLPKGYVEILTHGPPECDFTQKSSSYSCIRLCFMHVCELGIKSPLTILCNSPVKSLQPAILSVGRFSLEIHFFKIERYTQSFYFFLCWFKILATSGNYSISSNLLC